MFDYAQLSLISDKADDRETTAYRLI